MTIMSSFCSLRDVITECFICSFLAQPNDFMKHQWPLFSCHILLRWCRLYFLVPVFDVYVILHDYSNIFQWSSFQVFFNFSFLTSRVCISLSEPWFQLSVFYRYILMWILWFCVVMLFSALGLLDFRNGFVSLQALGFDVRKTYFQVPNLFCWLLSIVFFFHQFRAFVLSPFDF